MSKPGLVVAVAVVWPNKLFIEQQRKKNQRNLFKIYIEREKREKWIFKYYILCVCNTHTWHHVVIQAAPTTVNAHDGEGPPVVCPLLYTFAFNHHHNHHTHKIKTECRSCAKAIKMLANDNRMIQWIYL